MQLITNNKTYALSAFSPGHDGCAMAATKPIEIGDTLTVTDDAGVLLREYTVADYLRCEADGCTVRLTNTPEVVPTPPDLSMLKADKLAELSGACNASIVSGCDVAVSSGETLHYSLLETDQINLTAAVTACSTGMAAYPYHADGQLCRLYPAADILAIGDAATRHKLYHTTYCNHLMTWVRRVENVEELSDIRYGATLPDELAANMAEVLGFAE